RRIHHDASFPSYADAYYTGGEMPIRILRPQYRTAMPCPVHISPWFVGKWIVRCVGVRSQRMIAGIDTVSIPIPFGTRSGVLHIIGAVVFGEPGTFDISTQYGIGVIFPKAFPAVFFGCQIEQFHHFLRRPERFVHIKFSTSDGKFIGTSPEYVRLGP